MVTSIVSQDAEELNAYLSAARDKMYARVSQERDAQRAKHEAEQAARKSQYEAAYRVAQAALPEPLRSRLLFSNDPQEWRSSPYCFYLDLVGDEGAPLWLSINVEWYSDKYMVANYNAYYATYTWVEDANGVNYRQVVVTPSNYHLYASFEQALDAALYNAEALILIAEREV